MFKKLRVDGNENPDRCGGQGTVLPKRDEQVPNHSFGEGGVLPPASKLFSFRGAGRDTGGIQQDSTHDTIVDKLHLLSRNNEVPNPIRRNGSKIRATKGSRSVTRN